MNYLTTLPCSVLIIFLCLMTWFCSFLLPVLLPVTHSWSEVEWILDIMFWLHYISLLLCSSKINNSINVSDLVSFLDKRQAIHWAFWHTMHTTQHIMSLYSNVLIKAIWVNMFIYGINIVVIVVQLVVNLQIDQTIRLFFGLSKIW